MRVPDIARETKNESKDMMASEFIGRNEGVLRPKDNPVVAMLREIVSPNGHSVMIYYRGTMWSFFDPNLPVNAGLSYVASKLKELKG